MSPAILFLLALGLALFGWLAARARAWGYRKAAPAGRFTSLPAHYGWYVALWIVLPVLGFLFVWSIAAPQLVTASVLASPAGGNLPAFDLQRDMLLGEARNAATGATAGVFHVEARPLIEPFREAIGRMNVIGLVVTLALALAGGTWSFLRLRPDFAARTRVERIVMTMLLLASLVAILTTLGIFASLVFETVRFFGKVSPVDFLFGTHWGPDPMSSAETPDGSRYGAIPLRQPRLAQDPEADARDTRRRADGGLRLLRGAGCSVGGARRGPRFRHRQRLERERTCRRPRHGRDDHPVRVLDGG